MTSRRSRSLGLLQIGTLGFFIVALGFLGWVGYGALPDPTPTPVQRLVFNGQSALALAAAQCELGPRPAGSPAGWRTGGWIISQLEDAGWQVETSEFPWNNVPVRNILATAGNGPRILVGAHYDTRLAADNDPNPAMHTSPIVGGNDGASGVAVLLELARVLDVNDLRNEVQLVFFDAEANAGISGWKAAVGSEQLAVDLAADDDLPDAMILVDMVGEADQRFPYEMSSHPILRQQVWQLADRLGFGDVFVSEEGGSIPDSHTPFLDQGVPAISIIDIDYPHYRTMQDTCDKLSADSLSRVGRVLEVYLESGIFPNILPDLTE